MLRKAQLAVAVKILVSPAQRVQTLRETLAAQCLRYALLLTGFQCLFTLGLLLTFRPQFSASIHPSTLHNTSSSSRLNALRGPSIHGFPSLSDMSASQSIPSMVNPVAPPFPLPYILNPATSSGPACQCYCINLLIILTLTASLASQTPFLSFGSSVSPSSSTLAQHQPVHGSTVENSTSGSRAKRHIESVLNDDLDEHGRQEARARKQAERNAKRRRYKHFTYDGLLHQVIRCTGYILQALFSSENPYPDPDAKDRLIDTAYADACDVYDWSTDTYTLTDADMKMVRTSYPPVIPPAVNVHNLMAFFLTAQTGGDEHPQSCPEGSRKASPTCIWFAHQPNVGAA